MFSVFTEGFFTAPFIIFALLGTISIMSLVHLFGKENRANLAKTSLESRKEKLMKKMLKKNRSEKGKRLRKILGEKEVVDNYLFLINESHRISYDTLNSLLFSELSYGDYAAKTAVLIGMLDQNDPESLDSVVSGIHKLNKLRMNQQNAIEIENTRVEKELRQQTEAEEEERLKKEKAEREARRKVFDEQVAGVISLDLTTGKQEGV